MQAPFTAPAAPTFAICGWTERTPALLKALETRGLTPVAIGDRSAAALVAAAAAFRGRPDSPARYQHPREMLRRTGGDTVLLDMPEAAAEAIVLAQRGAAVLVAGDALEPETLEMLARMGAAASILRPLWWRAPIAAAIQATRPVSRLRHFTLIVGEDRPARAIAEDLVALAARISSERVESITVTAYGPAHGETASVVTELRFTGGVAALLVARSTLGVQVEADLSSFTTAIEAKGDGDGGSLTVTAAGRSTTAILAEHDPIALAVDDALDELAGGGMEPERLFEEAALLRAFGKSLEGIPSREVRLPRWDILAGGGHQSRPRRGHLHLVTG